MDDKDDVIFVGEELRACRVCLETGARLLELRHGPLADMYVDLTGIPVSPSDGMPQHMCSICAVLLKNSAHFKNKCRTAHAFLSQFADYKITMCLIRKLDKTKFKLPYTSTNTLTLNIAGDYEQNEIKEEIYLNHEKDENIDHTLSELVDIFDDPMLGEEQMEPQMIKEEVFEDTIIIKTNPNSIKKTISKSKGKHARITRTLKDNKEENIKDYLMKCKYQTYDHHKTLFYNYILDKYFYKTKVIQADDYDVSVVEEDTILNTVDFDKSVTSTNETVPENTELDKNIFFNYIKEKYVKKNVEMTKKVVNVTGLRVTKLKTNKVFKTKDELDKFAKTYNFEIIKLMKNEQRQDLEARRLSLAYQKSKFRCDECFRGFSTESVYKNHLTSHHPSSGCHMCEVCKLRFSTARKLKKHSLQHKTKFVCKECNRCFWSSSTARQHFKYHAGVQFGCEHCGLKFSKYESRVNHIRIHHGATMCDICYKGFQGVHGMKHHKWRAHKQTYQCDVCSVHFDNANAIKWHLSQSADGTCDPSVRACARCGERCSSEEMFKLHIWGHRQHKQSRPLVKRIKKQVKRNRECCTCPHFKYNKNGDTEYSDPIGEYSGPIGEYSGPNGECRVPASTCPCTYGDTCKCPAGSVRGCSGGIEPTAPIGQVTPGRLKWIHKGCCKEKTQVMCEMCGNIFGNDAALKLHLAGHKGDKPFQCPHCQKRFLRKQCMQTHVRTHTGARPYKCELCPKAFKSLPARHRHQLVHTNERRYRCEVCNKTFQTSSSVKLHVRTVHMRVPQPPRVRLKRRKCE